MSFFYGLVSQRGPFKETEEDYLRLTQPQYQQTPDPNASLKVIAIQQRTSGRIGGGAGGGDRPFRQSKTINGIEPDLGLTQEMVNLLVEKVNSQGFKSGEDGGVDQTIQMANFLEKLRKSTQFSYAVPTIEANLRIRFETTKDQLSEENFNYLNMKINNIKATKKDYSSVIENLAKVESLSEKFGRETASAKVMNNIDPKEATFLAASLNGELVVPAAASVMSWQDKTPAPPSPQSSNENVTSRMSAPPAPTPPVSNTVVRETDAVAVDDTEMGDLLPEAPLIAQQEQNIPFAKQNETSPDMLRDIREGKSKLKKPKPATSKKPPAKQARTINEILKEKIRQKMKEEEKEQMLRDKEKMLIRKKTVSSEGSRKGKK